jgi:hypothetical protein
MKIRCFDGPYHGTNQSINLGDRWPAVLEIKYNNPNILLGYYELRYGNEGQGYYWDRDSIEVFKIR